MIARIWKGAVRRSDSDAYSRYMTETGVAGYAATDGNAGVLGCLPRRDVGDNTEVSSDEIHPVSGTRPGRRQELRRRGLRDGGVLPRGMTASCVSIVDLSLASHWIVDAQVRATGDQPPTA